MNSTLKLSFHKYFKVAQFLTCTFEVNERAQCLYGKFEAITRIERYWRSKSFLMLSQGVIINSHSSRQKTYEIKCYAVTAKMKSPADISHWAVIVYEVYVF